MPVTRARRRRSCTRRSLTSAARCAGAAAAPADGAERSSSDPIHQPVPLLAVLPFDNLSIDPALEFFSDGVSEEILQTVARTIGIRVIGRRSGVRLRLPRQSPEPARLSRITRIG